MEFQILDVDYVTLNEDPVVRVFGKTAEGRSVCAFCEGFQPYFYSDSAGVEKAMGGDSQLVRIEKVVRRDVMGFQDPKDFWKVTVRNPQKVPEIRDKLASVGIRTCEADILFKYRFLNDMGLGGLCWAKADFTGTQTSTVTAGSCIRVKAIERVEREEDAPLRTLALDIECVPLARGGVPEAVKDPIVLISLVFSEPYKGAESMVLGTRATEGVDSFESEAEMLEGFLRIVEEYDPDILTGYNINNFDLPYMLERMAANRVKPLLGRCRQKPATARKVMSRHRATIPGRVCVDSFEIVKKDYSLPMYRLEHVARALLKEKKDDVRHSEIESLYRGSDEGYRKLAEYCRKDSYLAMWLVQRLNLVEKYVALSKVSGTLLQDALDSGETSRIDNFLLKEFNRNGYVMPNKPDAGKVGQREGLARKELKGGFVLEPEKGLQDNVVVLDFLSMYPSIIRTYNICPTTLVRGKAAEGAIETPLGARFVPPGVKKGIIPGILESLMENRARAKKKLRAAKTAEKKKLYHSQQYAFKIMMNAFYGHMGYARARVYDLEIASAITACGRDIIKRTKGIIEDEMGYRVVYGDTDSVMVKMKETDLEQIRVKGQEIADRVTGTLPGQMELQFEKVFRRFLPLTKKRYMAWAFEWTGDGWEDRLVMKGIETVRRDWCELVGDTTRNIIDIILKKDDVKEAVRCFRCVVQDLVKRKIDMQKLVVTKTMTKQVKSYAGVQPHIELVKKIRGRDPAEAPGIGDRIGYVIVKGTGLLSKRAEDPAYVVRNGLELDSGYYIENQLLPPVERIFGALGISKSELLGNGRQMLLCSGSFGPAAGQQPREAPLSDVTGFVCGECSRLYQTMPLVGRCECGGPLKFSTRNGAVERVLVGEQT
jgi:DNA polymerase I